MSGTSHIHPFAVGSGANTLTQAAWEALMAVPGGGIPSSGFLDGIASATQINTVLRQVSVVAAALAGFVVDVANVDVNDDGSVSAFETSFRAALDELYVPLSTLSDYVEEAAFTGANQQLTANGYQKLPGGLVLQWGQVTISAETETPVVFPTPFPTVVLSMQATCNYDGSSAVTADVMGMVRAVTPAGAYVCRSISSGGTAGAGVVYWLAVGR